MKQLLIATGLAGAMAMLPFAAGAQTTTEPPTASNPAGDAGMAGVHADVGIQIRDIEAMAEVSDVEVVEIDAGATGDTMGTTGATTTGSADTAGGDTDAAGSAEVTGSTGDTAAARAGMEGSADLHEAIRANSQLQAALDEEGVDVEDVVAVEIDGDEATVYVTSN